MTAATGLAPGLAPVLAAGSGATSGLGLVVVLVLVGATIFLFRSMNKQLRRLPPTFDAEEHPRLPEPADPADDALAAARGEVPRADQVGERPAERFTEPEDRPHEGA